MAKEIRKRHANGIRPWQIHLGVVLLAIALGFWMTADGSLFFDDPTRYTHSRWLLGQFGLMKASATSITKFYAPLWELILGIGTEFVFFPLRDPYWTRHALTFALYILSFYALFFWLRRAGFARSTTVLALAGLFGLIRLGGHSLFNMKDAPGALSYLLAGIYVWILLREGQQSGWRLRTLIALGIVSVIPFLVRSPLLTHTVLMLGIMSWIALFEKKITLRRRLELVGIPLVSATVFVLLVSPAFWSWNIFEWRSPLAMFAEYPGWSEKVVFMRHSFDGANTPWWYAFAWIPVIMHPLALCAAIAGALLLSRSSTKTLPSFRIPETRGVVAISLVGWLEIIVILSWIGVLIVHPKIYNEERHLLFLYPPLLLLCFLGFENMKNDRLKYGLAAMLIIASGYSYLRWGQYSYVYKSPVIGSISDGDFTADYWGLCLTKGFMALQGRVDPSTPIVSSYPNNYKQNVLRRKDLPATRVLQSYKITSSAPPDGTAYAHISLIGKYGGWDTKMLEDVAAKKTIILWEDRLPSGETACALLHIAGSGANLPIGH